MSERSPLPTTGISERHAAVLREALALFAERGYAGASLRELARRVGVKQPSLYHYFSSKDELVEQLLEHMASIFDVGAHVPPPASLEMIPRLLATAPLYLYRSTDWVLFVRFVFSVSLSEPRFRPQLKALFVDRMSAAAHQMTRPFVESGEISEQDALFLVRLTLNATSLLMIEQHLLYPGEEGVTDEDAFADFVARFVEAGLPSIRNSSRG